MYRPISLLPITSKLFEKVLLNERLQDDINLDEFKPSHQFGFRSKRSTIQQTRRIVKTTIMSLKKRNCTAAFLDTDDDDDNNNNDYNNNLVLIRKFIS